MSANLNSKRSVSETNVAIAIPIPAFRPKKLTMIEIMPSSVVDTVRSSSVILSGFAKFITLPIALIKNNTSKMYETALA